MTSYISQQNDVAKRINWILIDKVKIMLTQSKLSRKYWNKTVLITYYFYNKTLHSTINFIILFEIKFDKISNLNNIYVWKSSVWKKFFNIIKLTFQIKKHYLIGYDSNQWKLLNLFNEHTCWARDIQIVESPDETYENLIEKLIFPSDEKSFPLFGTLFDTLPDQILNDSKISFENFMQ